MSLVQLIDFETQSDARGQLVALESLKNIPFQFQRVYYMTQLQSHLPRGFHAHRQLRQVAVCIQGQCRFILNNGMERQEVWLKSSTQGLIIDKMIWHEMHDFSENCVLMILANDYHDESDYIRDYGDFIGLVNK